MFRTILIIISADLHTDRVNNELFECAELLNHATCYALHITRKVDGIHYTGISFSF